MDFEASLDKWVSKAEDNIEQVLHYAVTELSRRIIYRTPVGMPATWVKHRAPPGYVPGTARAGWHIHTGAPLVAVPTRPDAAGGRTLSAIVGALPAQIAGKVIYLSNNVPYIEELERGYSRQSPPSAMVALTVLEFNSFVSGKALEVAG